MRCFIFSINTFSETAMTKPKNVPSTLFLLFLQNQTVLRILDALPNTDLNDEMSRLLIDQAEILQSVIDADPFDPQLIEELCEDTIRIFDHYNQNSPLPKSQF